VEVARQPQFAGAFRFNQQEAKLVPEASEENVMQPKLKSAQVILFTLVLALPSLAQKSTTPGSILGISEVTF
jgi:hypothetical protein